MSTQNSIVPIKNKRFLINIIRVLVIFTIVLFLIFKRSFWNPDTLFVMLLIVFALFGQARSFIVRFAPLIILLLVYEAFRGVAHSLNTRVNFWPMIHADRWMGFGKLPTVWLQNIWWNGHLQWYDFYFYFLYTLHFLMPIVLGVWIWKKFGDSLFWQFILALLLLSYGGFLTYLLFPAAPPWMASDLGYIEPIHRISSDVWWAMGIKNFSEVWSQMTPNPVAAVPSLHAAYPTLFALFVIKMYGYKKAWWVWVYPISIWIGVVYLGEHYVIDVILGAIYAILAYAVANFFFVWQRKLGWPLKKWLVKSIMKPCKNILLKVKVKLTKFGANQ